MDREGVDAQVLYGSMTLSFESILDPSSPSPACAPTMTTSQKTAGRNAGRLSGRLPVACDFGEA